MPTHHFRTLGSPRAPGTLGSELPSVSVRYADYILLSVPKRGESTTTRHLSTRGPSCDCSLFRLFAQKGTEGRNELHSIMYKTAALTASLASLAAALQVPTRRQFAVGVGTAAVVPPALAAGGKVVVVGGAGFVGTEICHLLATQGVKDVVSVSRRSAAAQAQKVQYEQFVDFVSLDASKDDLSSVSVWKSMSRRADEVMGTMSRRWRLKFDFHTGQSSRARAR